MADLEFTREPFEIVAADEALDDRKFERKRAQESRMQLCAVDFKARASANAAKALG